MKKRMLLFAAVALSAVRVLGYAVDTTHSVFCFEDGEVMNRSTDGSSWLEGDTIYNVTNHNLTASSQPNFYRVGIEKPGVTVKS